MESVNPITFLYQFPCARELAVEYAPIWDWGTNQVSPLDTLRPPLAYAANKGRSDHIGTDPTYRD